MSYTNWEAIVKSTKLVLEDTCADLLNINLKYADQLIYADNIAASIFDGTYFIRLQGVPKVDDTVNGQFNVDYTVSLEVCYEISAGNSVESYNTAMEDIEIIIRERLKQSSWVDYNDNIQYVRVESISEPKYLLKGEIFMIVPINLTFTMISNY